MEREEIRIKLVDIIRGIIDDNSVNAETAINEIALDSLRFVKAVVQIEKAFKIKFADEDLLLHQYERIEDICVYVETRMNKQD